MNLQIVMDATGDTRHSFDALDPIECARAERRFREITGRGYHAVALAGDGEPGRLNRDFDATVEKTLFIPQLIGG
jgi:hypothetical protein